MRKGTRCRSEVARAPPTRILSGRPRGYLRWCVYRVPRGYRIRQIGVRGHNSWVPRRSFHVVWEVALLVPPACLRLHPSRHLRRRWHELCLERRYCSGHLQRPWQPCASFAALRRQRQLQTGGQAEERLSMYSLDMPSCSVHAGLYVCAPEHHSTLTFLRHLFSVLLAPFPELVFESASDGGTYAIELYGLSGMLKGHWARSEGSMGLGVGLCCFGTPFPCIVPPCCDEGEPQGVCPRWVRHRTRDHDGEQQGMRERASRVGR